MEDNKLYKVIFKLTDEVTELESQLEYSDKQLEIMASAIDSKDEVIRKLTELIIETTSK